MNIQIETNKWMALLFPPRLSTGLISFWLASWSGRPPLRENTWQRQFPAPLGQTMNSNHDIYSGCVTYLHAVCLWFKNPHPSLSICFFRACYWEDAKCLHSFPFPPAPKAYLQGSGIGRSLLLISQCLIKPFPNLHTLENPGKTAGHLITHITKYGQKSGRLWILFLSIGSFRRLSILSFSLLIPPPFSALFPSNPKLRLLFLDFDCPHWPGLSGCQYQVLISMNEKICFA